MSVLPGAEPFHHDGGRVGVVLCHGFTGSPQGLRDWARALADAGHTVRLPLLPGHGTSWHDLNRTRWTDWYAEVDRALTELRERCDAVVVAGLSMGGALALRLAQEHPDDVAGVVLVNPSVSSQDRRLTLLLPWLRHVVPSFPGIGSDIKKTGAVELAYDRAPLHAVHSLTRLWQVVSADLGRVTAPVLLLRSAVDHVVPASSSAAVLAGISSGDVTEIVLPDSYHVATLDHDADRIVEESLRFVERVAAGRGAEPGRAG